MTYVLIFLGFVAVCFVFGQMVKNTPAVPQLKEDHWEESYQLHRRCGDYD